MKELEGGTETKPSRQKYIEDKRTGKRGEQIK